MHWHDFIRWFLNMIVGHLSAKPSLIDGDRHLGTGTGSFFSIDPLNWQSLNIFCRQVSQVDRLCLNACLSIHICLTVIEVKIGELYLWGSLRRWRPWWSSLGSSPGRRGWWWAGGRRRSRRGRPRTRWWGWGWSPRWTSSRPRWWTRGWRRRGDWTRGTCRG